MSFQRGMSLLESFEFSNVVQVVSSDNDGSVHFVGDHQSFVQLSSDGGEASEWAFVVNVVSFLGFLGDLES